MRSDSYALEMGGTYWVLHVFSVDGEDEEVGVILSFGTEEACSAFPDRFEEKLISDSGPALASSLCVVCRDDRDEWLSKFSDWIKDAYSLLEHPPRVHDDREVPDAVKLSLECMLHGGSPSPQTPN